MSEPANDNPEPVTTTITLTDLAAALGIDEDEILQRFAKIMAMREAADALSPPSPAPEAKGEAT